MSPEEKEEKNRIRRMRRAERRRIQMAEYRRRDGIADRPVVPLIPADVGGWRMAMTTNAPPPAPKMPEFLSAEIIGMAERLGLQWDCPICIESKPPREFILAPCGHRICGGCRASMEASSLRRVCPECRA